ncbi:MAG TPA: hypothetical protein EYG78_01210 [Sulfurovum sp.]|nr:hypothetical protein [Sulfurovum sp.]
MNVNTVEDVTTGVANTGAEIVEAEVIESLEPIQVTGVLQFVIPTPTEAMHMMYQSLVRIQQTLDTQTQIMDAIYNEQSLDVLKDIRHKLDVHILSQTIEWTTLSILADKKGLTKDAIRKQLQNGDFEEGVDFKFDGNKIIVHQGAIGRIQRKRRSSNG